MRGRVLTSVLSGVCASAVALAVLSPPSTGVAARASKATYEQPKPGSWKVKDPFEGSSGTLKVKAGTKGKAPKVVKLTITVGADPDGYMCPATGSVAKVNGSFPLRKAPKWADDDFDEYAAWISAAKDKPYDDSSPNMLGMKPTPVTIKVGTETRNGALAISFRKSKRNKPHDLDYSLYVWAPGETGVGEGYCLLYGLDGKPGK